MASKHLPPTPDEMVHVLSFLDSISTSLDVPALARKMLAVSGEMVVSAHAPTRVKGMLIRAALSKLNQDYRTAEEAADGN